MSRKISPPDPQTSMQLRKTFYDAIENNDLSIAETIKQMRKIVGMTQTDYAKLIGIAPRIVMDIERGKANPRLDTLNKLAKPFGLALGFVINSEKK